MLNPIASLNAICQRLASLEGSVSWSVFIFDDMSISFQDPCVDFGLMTSKINEVELFVSRVKNYAAKLALYKNKVNANVVTTFIDPENGELVKLNAELNSIMRNGLTISDFLCDKEKTIFTQIYAEYSAIQNGLKANALKEQKSLQEDLRISHIMKNKKFDYVKELKQLQQREEKLNGLLIDAKDRERKYQLLLGRTKALHEFLKFPSSFLLQAINDNIDNSIAVMASVATPIPPLAFSAPNSAEYPKESRNQSVESDEKLPIETLDEVSRQLIKAKTNPANSISWDAFFSDLKSETNNEQTVKTYFKAVFSYRVELAKYMIKDANKHLYHPISQTQLRWFNNTFEGLVRIIPDIQAILRESDKEILGTAQELYRNSKEYQHILVLNEANRTLRVQLEDASLALADIQQIKMERDFAEGRCSALYDELVQYRKNETKYGEAIQKLQSIRTFIDKINDGKQVYEAVQNFCKEILSPTPSIIHAGAMFKKPAARAKPAASTTAAHIRPGVTFNAT